MIDIGRFKAIGIDIPYGARGNVKVKCPKCSKGREKDLSVNVDKGLYKCHKSKCGWKGSVNHNYKVPENNFKALIKRNVSYLETRGISAKTIEKLKIGSNNNNHIRFNYFRDDQLVNYKDRIKVGEKKTFRQHPEAEHILYNLNSLKGKQKAIIVEGEMDVATLVECGLDDEYGIVSVDQGAGEEGSKMDGKLECIGRCFEQINAIHEWVICTDNDGPGNWLAECLIERFGDIRCRRVSYVSNRNDVNEMLTVEGLDKEINIEGIVKMVKAARWVKAKGIIELDESVASTMLDYYDHGLPKGTPAGFECMEPRFSWLPGDITLIYGIPNYGKSTFARQLMLIQSYLNSAKWACYVPEDMPEALFYEELCHMFVGMPTDKERRERMTRQQFITSMDFVRDHFYILYPQSDKKTGHMDLPSNPWLNDRINSLRIKFGVNGYCKDPWNQIFHDYDGREDQYLQAEISKEKFFASDFKYSLYVAHPKTLRKQKGEEKFNVPDPYDISGGSMFYNKFDNILCVHKPNNDNPADLSVDIHAQKIKKRKLVGTPGVASFEFNRMSNRYLDMTRGHGVNPLPGLGNDMESSLDDAFSDFQWDSAGNSNFKDNEEFDDLMDSKEDIPF